jgi:acetate kinase
LIVLALNSGSSSLKAGLYRVGPQGVESLFAHDIRNMSELPHQLPAPDAVAHRIVHGGPSLREHCVINDGVLAQIEAAAPFAPLHTPAALALIRQAQQRYPALPQVACFDTTFHAGMPDVARVLPLPMMLLAEGVQRYGFHGLSCESIVHALGAELPARLVIAHLGHGASITAVARGRSVDTSMGLTPTGGLIMGTRSGDLDPGVLVYLLRKQKLDAAALERLLDQESGLLGISGVSGDMRRLHEAASTHPAAQLAIDMFCRAVCKQVAAMTAVLGGADMIVLTGGIGENDRFVHDAVGAGLAWMGAGTAQCPVRVMASQEDEQLARHAWGLLRLG